MLHRRDLTQNFSGLSWHKHKAIKALWLQTFEAFIADQYLEAFFRGHWALSVLGCVINLAAGIIQFEMCLVNKEYSTQHKRISKFSFVGRLFVFTQ